MKTLMQACGGQKGLSLIPVLMVSAVLASVLTVWMIQFGTKANSNSHEWVQKENFRIGTELAKQVGLAYENYYQHGNSCSSGVDQNVAGSHFCFPPSSGTGGPGSNTSTGACTTSPFLAGGSTICIHVITQNHLPPFLGDSPTFVARFHPAPRLSFLLPKAWGVMYTFPSNPVTAIDCSATPTVPQCHQCGGTSGFTCYQLAYCSVADPTCASYTSMQQVSVMIKTN